LLTDFDQTPAAAGGVESSLREADLFLPGLAALGQGKWVSVNARQLEPLIKQGERNASGNSKSKTDSAALLNHLKSALINNTTYANAGNHGGRTEYRLNVQAKDVLRQLSSDLSNLAQNSTLPGASGATSQMTDALNHAIAKAPQHVVLQLWVKDNKMQEVDLDLNQFAHKYPFALPLRILIGSGSPVAAPLGATPLQISRIAGLLGGLGGLGGSSMTPAPAAR